MNILAIARVCHEINKAYCEALGDHSQQVWEDAPDWQRESAIKGVTFHLENPDAPASASHDSWMKQKEEDGWVYGEVKDPDKKEHPCMVPFEELPTDQQAKDFLFRQTVHSLKPFLTESVGEGPGERPMSLGERRVHLDFNPSADDKIGNFKRMMADAIDVCQEELLSTEDGEAKRCFAIAQTELETAQMYAVKGIAKGLPK